MTGFLFSRPVSVGDCNMKYFTKYKVYLGDNRNKLKHISEQLSIHQPIPKANRNTTQIVKIPKQTEIQPKL